MQDRLSEAAEIISGQSIQRVKGSIEREEVKDSFPQNDLWTRQPFHAGGNLSARAQASRLNRVIANQPSGIAGSILRLQRKYGNGYVQHLLNLARQGEGGKASADVEAAIEAVRGGGQALDSGVRMEMEPAFGADFSGVRVHADTQADTLNRAVNARAFTTGQDIFFRDGEYSTDSSAGRELLAHELTHVVQQSGGVRAKLEISQPDDPAEQEADEVAQAVTRQAEVRKPESLPGGKSIPGNLAAVGRKRLQRDHQEVKSETKEHKSDPEEELRITAKTPLEAAITNVRQQYLWLFDEKKKGIAEFQKAAAFKEKPTILGTILKTCALVALAALTEGFGEFIAGGVVIEGISEHAEEVIHEVVKVAVSDSIKEGVEKGYEQIKDRVAEREMDALEAFVFIQNEALDEANRKTINIFDLSTRFREEDKKHPGTVRASLEKLRAELEGKLKDAAKLQFNASLDQWAVANARAELQEKKLIPETGQKGEKGGLDLSSLPGAGSINGVLNLLASVDDRDPSIQIGLFRASISGLSEPLMNNLQKRPIASLGIPIVIYIFIGGLLDRLIIRRNEAGMISVDGSPKGLLWLHDRFNPREQPIRTDWPKPPPSREHDLRHDYELSEAYKAAKPVIERDARFVLENYIGSRSILEWNVPFFTF